MSELWLQLPIAAGVVGLAAAATWKLRGHAGPLGRTGAAERRLRCEERLILAPGHSLHRVRHGSRVLLVGVSPAGCRLLETLSAEESQ